MIYTSFVFWTVFVLIAFILLMLLYLWLYLNCLLCFLIITSTIIDDLHYTLVLSIMLYVMHYELQIMKKSQIRKINPYKK